MADELVVFAPDLANEMLATFKAIKAKGLLEPDLEAKQLRGNPVRQVTHPQPPIFVRNDSGQTIPPYAFMQATGTVNVTDSFCYVTVKQPTDTTTQLHCPLLINGIYEIPNGDYGVAQNGPVFSLWCDTTRVAGDRLGPRPDEWYSQLGSMYAVIGEDETAIETDVYKVMFDTSTARGKTVSGGITAGATGTVKLYKADGTLGTNEYTAETVVSSIAADTEILLFSQYGRWFAVGLC
jgi:hypothetical protein